MKALTQHARYGAIFTALAITLAVAFVEATWLVSESLAAVALALPAGVLLIANTVAMRIQQHEAPMTTIRALGSRRERLHRVTHTRALRVALPGSALGAVLGVVIALPFGLHRNSLPAIPVAIALGVATTLITVHACTSAVLRRSAAPHPSHHDTRRLWSPVALTLAAVALLIGGATIWADPGGTRSDLDRGTGVLGALLVWLGVILLAPLIAMALLWPVAKLIAAFGGPVSRVAARDALRHPRRSAAIATSILTGVSLISAFSAIGALFGLVIVVAAFEVVRTLLFSGLDRRPETAALRSLGASRIFLRRAIRRENVIITTCAALVGLGVGALLGSVMRHLMQGQSLTNLILPFPTLIAVLGVLIGVAAMATWWPAGRRD